jgi:hypothetical protein
MRTLLVTSLTSLHKDRQMAKLTTMVLAFAVMLTVVADVCGQSTQEELKEKATETVEKANDKVKEVTKTLNESEQAKEVAAGILKPIYQLAEKFSFPAFHWIAFCVMVAGVVSFALQLTLGKLLVLAKSGFSPAEILSDALGLAVSLIGLVLTTQAAAENSSFTASAAAVLSSTVAGAIAGFIFYIWGQRQELQAVQGRSRVTPPTIKK